MTLYRKQGRRYVPVAEYSPEAADSLPYGAHLVLVEPGGRYTRFCIDPDHAAVLAAIDEHRASLANAIVQASAAARAAPMTGAQEKAWAALKETFGGAIWSIQWPAAIDVVEALRTEIMRRAQ